MAICPICQSDIGITTQHYGALFTCPKCNAVFFVDWEGRPESSIGETSDEVSNDGSAPVYEPPAEEVFTYPEESLEEVPIPEEVASSYDLSDIADFGNADLGQAAFNYTLTIAGIDSGLIRAQIEEALSDAKFNWNVIQLMAQINGGVLTIQSLNAVKASILMQRVKYLPVKLSWRQNVLSSPI